MSKQISIYDGDNEVRKKPTMKFSLKKLGQEGFNNLKEMKEVINTNHQIKKEYQ